MDTATFLDNFGAIAEAPGGVEQLRRFILDQAVAGRLLTTAADDSTVIAELMRTRKAALLEAGAINAPRKFKGRPLTEHVYPSNWTSVHLGDVCLVVMGNSPPGDSYNDAGAGVPLINGPVEFSVGPFGETRRTKFTTDPGRMCEPGDLLVCVRGATTGRTNIASFEACIGRGVALVRGWESQGFINLFMWRIGKHLLATGKGTTFPSISYDDLAGLAFGLPPLAEQQLIVERVHELMQLCDDLEAQQQARNDVATRLRASSLDALTTADNEDDFQTAWSRIDDNWAKVSATVDSTFLLSDAIKDMAVRGALLPSSSDVEEIDHVIKLIQSQRDSLRLEGKMRKKAKQDREVIHPPFKIPSSWEWVRLGWAAIEMRYGSSSKSELSGDVPVLRMGNLQSGEIDWSNLKYTSDPQEISKYSLDAPAVLFNRTNSKELVGKTAIYRGERQAAFAGYLIHVRASVGLDPEYLNLVLNSPMARRWCWTTKTDGISQSNISASKLAELPVPLPPMAEQKQIVARTSELDRLVVGLRDSLERKNALAAAFAQATAITTASTESTEIPNS